MRHWHSAVGRISATLAAKELILPCLYEPCLCLQALDAAMKQYKALSPSTAAMFFSVDEDANKILCMSCVPKVKTGLQIRVHI